MNIDKSNIQLIAIHNADKKRVDIFNEKAKHLINPFENFPMPIMVDYDTLRGLALDIHYENTSSYQLYEKLVTDDKYYRHNFDMEFVFGLIDRHVNFSDIQYRPIKYYVFQVDPTKSFIPSFPRHIFLFVFMKRVLYTNDSTPLAVLTYTDEPQVWEQPITDESPLISKEHFKRLEENDKEFQDGYIVVRRKKEE